jgi:hypothetical protein
LKTNTNTLACCQFEIIKQFEKTFVLHLFLYYFLFFYLIRSGTGKSSLLKHLVESVHSDRANNRGNSASAKIKHLYLLNVKASESKAYTKYFEDVTMLDSFDKLKSTQKNALIIVEDIINMSKNDEKLLRTALNYDAHHKRQKIFCVSHSIYKNSIWSLLSFFHYIIFTSAPSNVPVLRFTFNYFKIEKPQFEDWLKEYLTVGQGGKKGTYFYFDCVKMTFNVSENTQFTKKKLLGTLGDDSKNKPETNLVGSEEHRKKLQSKFETLIESFECQAQAIAIFSILVNCLNSNLIREHDLSFAFKSSRHKHVSIRFSLVDYITSMLTSGAPVTKPLLAFHNYVKSYCHIPVIFYRNQLYSK